MILNLPKAKKDMKWYFTANMNQLKIPEANIHFSDGQNGSDLSISRNWMEHIENQSKMPGAYDVLRCDLVKTRDSATPSFKVWGQDYHFNRLERSYKELVKHHFLDLIDDDQDDNHVSVKLNEVKVAHEQSDAILNSLLKKMMDHEESQIKEEAIGHDIICEIIRVTILWTPQLSNPQDSSPQKSKIVVKGHASTSGQVMVPTAIPKMITATLALPNNLGSQVSSAVEELPDRHICPHAKISSWSKQRRSLESKKSFKPEGVEEVLLLNEIDDKGRTKYEVLEGLTSNFFAIYKDGTIRTPADGVLLGYVRHLILESAEACGLKVDERPIDLEDGEKGLWEETFITSSSRLIYPIEKILIPDYENSSESQVGLKWNTFWELKKAQTKDYKWLQLLSEILKRAGYE
jgi:hypothetical protein